MPEFKIWNIRVTIKDVLIRMTVKMAYREHSTTKAILHLFMWSQLYNLLWYVFGKDLGNVWKVSGWQLKRYDTKETFWDKKNWNYEHIFVAGGVDVEQSTVDFQVLSFMWIGAAVPGPQIHLSYLSMGP